MEISQLKVPKRLLIKTSSRTVWADQVRNKRPPSHFAFATWTSHFILHFYNAQDVSSPKLEWFGKGKYFIHWRRDKIKLMIKTVALLYLIMGGLILPYRGCFCNYYFVAFTMIWTYPVRKYNHYKKHFILKEFWPRQRCQKVQPTKIEKDDHIYILS